MTSRILITSFCFMVLGIGAAHTKENTPSEKIELAESSTKSVQLDQPETVVAPDSKEKNLTSNQPKAPEKKPAAKKTVHKKAPVKKKLATKKPSPAVKNQAKKAGPTSTTQAKKEFAQQDFAAASIKQHSATSANQAPTKKLIPSKKLKDFPVEKKAASLTKASEISATSRLISGEHDTKLNMPEKKAATAVVKKQTSTISHDEDDYDNEKDPLDDEDDEDDDDEEDDDDDLVATPAPSNKKIMIRVLLKEFPTEQKITFAIQSNRGFVLESPIASGHRARWQHQILNLLAYQHNLFLLTENGSYKRIKTNELAIASIDGDLKIDNYRYTGTIYLRIDSKTKMVQMVNKINLDDYIYSVLRYESLSHWPLEMQKIQAVASRSYAVRQIKIARGSSSTTPFYDIKNNNFHQVYNGNHNSTHLREAVYATHNLILAYNGDIALTMFDICCGGIIPGYMKKRDADKPYLYRKTRCTYCHNKANFEWNCAFNKDVLLSRMLESTKLQSKAKRIGKIIGISLKEKDRAGIVHRILIHGSKNNVILTSNEFKSALGAKAKSNAYVVKKLNDDITVHGYGFGHNMGLCQIGARELISRGRDYQEVLEFYFPKTRLMRLKVI